MGFGRWPSCVRNASDSSAATVIREIKGVEGGIVRKATFTREIIGAADALQVIGRHGVGVDNGDVQAATERGIVVTNTQNANTISWSDIAATIRAAQINLEDTYKNLYTAEAKSFARQAHENSRAYCESLLALGRLHPGFSSW